MSDYPLNDRDPLGKTYTARPMVDLPNDIEQLPVDERRRAMVNNGWEEGPDGLLFLEPDPSLGFRRRDD